MRITKEFKQAMTIGNIFWNEYNNHMTEEWRGSEECSEMCRRVIEYMKEHKVDEYDAIDAVLIQMLNGDIIGEEHMWDDICKGFLAGEILGKPTDDNLKKVREAEELWKDTDYGYYQEVLNEVA